MFRDSEPTGFRNRFGPVGDHQLAQNRGDVVVDSLLGDHQALCDLSVSRPEREEFENFELACGQPARILPRDGMGTSAHVAYAPFPQ